MTTATKEKQDTIPGLDNARGWYSLIVEMVEQLEEAADLDRGDGPRERIEESVLSVEVRSGWYSPGAQGTDTKPAEFKILLTTGGPALQIVGDLDEYGQPESAELESQDWFVPWTRLLWSDVLGDEAEPYTDKGIKQAEAYRETLLTFARVFYFGE